jgi:broad specificity phosphatase PhoE
MLRVIVVRHAEVERSWKIICYGQRDVPLSEEGQQASARYAAQFARSQSPLAIYHSGLTRTKQLATFIGSDFPEVPVVFDQRLQERNYGRWEGRSWDEVYQSDPENFHGLIEKPDSYRPPDGETTTDMQTRVVNWFSQLPRPAVESTIIAISHSGPIAALAGHCLNLHARDWAPWILKNLEAIEIVELNSRIQVHKHSCV